MKEAEVRYRISEAQKKEIIKVTNPYKQKEETLDISFYKGEKNLFDLYRYIIRIRKKNNSKKIEIKKYGEDINECEEGAIKIDNIKEAVHFFSLMDLQPGIYLKRKREVRLYGELKIFIDEFDMLGDFVEIEYQDCKDSELKINEFKELCGINSEPERMYGAIVNDLLLTDKNFKKEYMSQMNKIIEGL